ncbi:ribonuclease HII [Aquibacillus kalidii]|uniref:ribonuclease HII n=1 Tax=Aquibacillus kalidii TaxID=2762597 RepID=UPI0016474B8F|nr:ribonuclease HII [Aquibacillus kalidii]
MTKQLTIAQVSEMISDSKLSADELLQLKQDKRIGVKKLVEKYERQQELEKLEKEKFVEMMTFEQARYLMGDNYIAGIDEAGRGPLAGPVVAAAVILTEDFYLAGLNDSKQLNKRKRDYFFDYIKTNAFSYGIGIIHNNEIDSINILQATKKAMKSAIQQLDPIPDHILVDAVKLDELPCTSESIIKGDQKSVSIAAASILAKVTRDRLMEELDKEYPMYQFASNMGYGTKDHLLAIEKYGITPYHRRTFAPVSNYSNL